MMANTLDPNRSRIGFLSGDGIPDSNMVADLSLTEDGIIVRVPWNHSSRPEYERWFGDGIQWGDDPEKTKFKYNPPQQIDFQDSNGRIVLSGCHSRGSKRNPISRIGTGIIGVDYAILGATSAENYSSINGFRSEIEGLGTWMNLSSLSIKHTSDADGRLRTVEMKLESPEEVRVHRNLNLKVVPSFQYDRGPRPDETVINERMYVESLVKRSRSWDEHLNLHIKMRDLLRLSSWRQLNFLSHKATREDDPLRTLDGAGHGRVWYEVHTFRTKVAENPSEGSVNFLFSYSDLSKSGISTWIKLHDSMARGIDPIISLLDLENGTINSAFAQIGIGLEALGYLIAIEKGVSKKKAGDQTFENRLQNIWNDIKTQPPTDGTRWIRDTTKLYNSVKHANRTAPMPKDLRENFWRSVLIFRFWIAGRLGVSSKTIHKAARIDQIAQAVKHFDSP
ncbi:HEPN domain-containing protein [Glycomyces sp. NPDC047010]|uniref:ApeA N-terminal domain 1-containing protein n=1 Tax=Glycomyces sp. NPDC047010 TaxID=3155023 RepID=UPI0033CCE4BB